jgi:hypothetical protein
MTKKKCPLGEDCDLTIAWMAGAARSKDRIMELEAKLAKAVNVIDWALIAWDEHDKYGHNMQGDWVSDARTTLAELTGARMTDEEMITRLRGNITLSKEGACVTLLFTDPPKELGNCETYGFCEEVADRIEAQDAEIERLRDALKKAEAQPLVLESVARGTREGESMTSWIKYHMKEARAALAELTGGKDE